MDASRIKRLIISLLLVAGSAFAGPDDILITQRNGLDTGNIQRVTAHPTSGPGLLRYNLATLLPDWVTLAAPLQFNGSDLEIVWANADWNAVSGNSQIINKPSFQTLAFTGLAADITNATTVGRNVLTAATQADGRTALGITSQAFNFGFPAAKTIAVNTSYQAADNTKPAIITPSFACQNATQILASSACTLNVRVHTSAVTCSTGTVIYTQSLTVGLGLLLTQNSTNPVQINLPTGAHFIICPTAGTFTITAVEQVAGN